MKILDWYIFKRFLRTYLFVVSMVTLIILVVDYTEKVEDFIRNKPPTYELFVTYYLNLAIFWANYVSPLMVFITVVFFTANMAAKTEIIAILSTGVSFLRFTRPYALASLLIAGLIFYLVSYVIPIADTKRLAFEQKYVHGGTYYYDKRDVHIQVSPNVYAYLSSYNNSTQQGDKFTLEKIENNRLVQKLTASYIVWKPELKKWSAVDYSIRTITETGETMTYGKSLDTTLALEPKDFESTQDMEKTFTLTELNKHIQKLQLRGAEGVELYQIERYSRMANPFAIIILTAIGVIVSARKSRGGVGFQIALGFALAFLYILFFMMSSGIAKKGAFDPFWAVWLPNIVFSVIGVVLYRTVPK
ncbi:LptF/LptG family permease [Siphonobacter aquaeclarae]|uniref:Lipopolysaccharide export system permease protein n=1 Tax=Siphonobacter aquaeclarae TaxID=563176 RepID=A0A1G9QEB5_9BACT|nr:LptF/LptG family permease [Siphonobacter aquaeclarae]MBO9639808.1 LptF/LptG family permease [Siphonobacter aquaeclarae]SDM09378.1 lipopolysaccharide export system permease protein [Siphonobacter aquaeclarae]